MLKEFRPDTEVKLWFPQSVPAPDEDKPCIYDIDPECLDSLNEETKFAITL